MKKLLRTIVILGLPLLLAGCYVVPGTYTTDYYSNGTGTYYSSQTHSVYWPHWHHHHHRPRPAPSSDYYSNQTHSRHKSSGGYYSKTKRPATSSHGYYGKKKSATKPGKNSQGYY